MQGYSSDKSFSLTRNQLMLPWIVANRLVTGSICCWVLSMKIKYLYAYIPTCRICQMHHFCLTGTHEVTNEVESEKRTKGNQTVQKHSNIGYWAGAILVFDRAICQRLLCTLRRRQQRQATKIPPPTYILLMFGNSSFVNSLTVRFLPQCLNTIEHAYFHFNLGKFTYIQSTDL